MFFIAAGSSSDDDGDGDDNVVSQRSVFQPLRQFVFFLLLWQAFYCVSNAALNILLKFLSTFARVFGTVFASDMLQQFSSEIHHSTIAAHKLLWNSSGNNFVGYVVCPRFHQ